VTCRLCEYFLQLPVLLQEVWNSGGKLWNVYKVVSKIFRADAVKIVKQTIRPIGRRHPRSSSLPHVDTGPTVSSIFGTLPGSPFLSDCQALSVIRPVSPQWYQTGVLSASISFLEIGRIHRVPNQGSMVCGGWQPFCFSPETAGTLAIPFPDPSWKSPQVTYTTTDKRVWKLPTSIQIRATWYSNSLDMVVLPSTGASRYHNYCIDGGTSPENFGYHLV